MTNAEAIRILRNAAWFIAPYLGSDTSRERVEKAVGMAIKSLEPQELSKNSPKLDKENGDLQPTCNELAKDTNVPCKDTISRQAAIDAPFKKYDMSTGVTWIPLEYVEQLPSAQPEITHCKDCKHFGVDRYKKLTWCSRINYGYGYQADDFCSKAERRTDEGD